MALNKVEICGVDTSKLPILKEEEKRLLFERIKEGDIEAKEEYIKGNLRLVLSVIRRFSNTNEILNEGTKIVKKAVEKPAKARAASAFNRVVLAAKHLMEVVLKNEGLANKDLAKFESQIQNLADKWDR